LKTDWKNYTPPRPWLTGGINSSIPAGQDRRIHRLVAVLPGMGTVRALPEDIGRMPSLARRHANCLRCAGDAEEDHRGKMVTANAVFGLFPANTVNSDDIEIYTDETRQEGRG